jgi:hypothetical protein
MSRREEREAEQKQARHRGAAIGAARSTAPVEAPPVEAPVLTVERLELAPPRDAFTARTAHAEVLESMELLGGPRRMLEMARGMAMMKGIDLSDPANVKALATVEEVLARFESGERVSIVATIGDLTFSVVVESPPSSTTSHAL